MFEASEQVTIAAPPSRVWSALTDFAQYGQWHPFMKLEGRASAGAEVQYTLYRKLGGRTLTTTARISACDEPRLLSFEMGVPRLLWVEEWYSIAPAGAGACLKHGMRFSGILTFVARFKLKRYLYLLGRPIQSLARYLAPPVQPVNVTGKSGKPKRRNKPKRRR